MPRVTDRRTALLDGAITVLGEQGVRALTHRSADAAAGAPVGSASNYFRTREALLDAVVIRIAERESRHWTALADRRLATTADLAAVLADFAVDATTAHRTLVLARYALLVEAGCRLSLRRQLRATGAELSSWFMATLTRLGSFDVGRDANLIMNYWTGMVLHELALPAETFEPRPYLTELLLALLPGSPTTARI
ncbi:MAG TPA: TetR/AcrR family transcriptional regulator [Microlunatus sp.]